MADNDVQDMVRRIQKTLPRPLDELSRDDLQNHLADIANNPSQYGLPGVGARDAGNLLRSRALDEIRAQHTAAHGGADPGSDWIMNTGLQGVGTPSTGPPHPPDPTNIDDLFDPTDLGPNATLPGTIPPMDPELEELIRQTDALRPPSGPAPQEGIDVPTYPGDAMAAGPMNDPTGYGTPTDSGMAPEGGGSGGMGPDETSGFNC